MGGALSFVRNGDYGGYLLCNSGNANGDSAIGTVTGRFHGSKLHVIRVPGSELVSFPLLISGVTTLPLGFVVFVSSLSFRRRSRDCAALGTILRNKLTTHPSGTLVCTASGHERLIGRDVSSEARAISSVGIHSGVRRDLSLSSHFNLTIYCAVPSGGSFLRVMCSLTRRENIGVARRRLTLNTRRFTLSENNHSPEYTERCIRSLFY